MNVALFDEKVGEVGATVFQATPTYFQMLSSVLDDTSANVARLQCLCGGEAFPASLGKAMMNAFQTIYNVYIKGQPQPFSNVSAVTYAASGGGALDPCRPPLAPRARSGRPSAPTNAGTAAGYRAGQAQAARGGGLEVAMRGLRFVSRGGGTFAPCHTPLATPLAGGLPKLKDRPSRGGSARSQAQP